MDPLTASISIILGKYALDKGLELGKEVGPKALDKAVELATSTLARLRADPAGKVIADEFEKAPQVYQKPVEQKLDEVIQSDPDFAAQLKTLLEEYETAAQEHAQASGTTYQATLKGSGAIAQGGSVAAGQGGIAVGGNVQGDIHTSEKKNNAKDD